MSQISSLSVSEKATIDNAYLAAQPTTLKVKGELMFHQKYEPGGLCDNPHRWHQCQFKGLVVGQLPDFRVTSSS